ncbi:MAG TPA: citramalate synthase, partial [Solirubrobacteraceae bacterium]
MNARSTRIELYDATLRDGMGGGGMTLTAEEKLRVVHALDELGVHMIEAGFPSSNPKELELFSLLAAETLQNAEIVAFGMTRRRDTAVQEDDGLRVLAESFAPVCTIVGKASVLHVEKVVRVSREENLAMIADSVAFLVRAGKRVLLDAEHFFDGFALDPAYSLDCLRVAAEAGAERLVLCDTNGGSLPPHMRTAFAVVSEALPGTPLGIHTHDDSGCAVANTLTAVECGATQVQGTINGIGERTGNANLITIIADLQLKMGAQLLAPERLARLTETAHFVDELLNRTPNPAQPYVGKHAFAHKAGLHAAGVRAEPQTFEHIDPAIVGNDRDVLISELSGRGTVVEKARTAGIAVDDALAGRVVERVKALEHEGFQFEAADGSFELLLR